MTTAAQLAWLESSAKIPCALARLTFLGNNAGAGGEMHAYVGNVPYISHASDTPAHQIFETCLVEAPSFTARMAEQLEGRSESSYGDLILSNESPLQTRTDTGTDSDGQARMAGVRDDWLRMNWDGRKIEIWIGDPSWAFADFIPFLNGAIVDVYDAGPYKIGIKISGKEALLDRPVMTTLLGGNGPEANALMPLALGFNLINLKPKLIDTATNKFRVSLTDPSGPTMKAMYDSSGTGSGRFFPFTVRENGVSLTASLIVSASDAGTDVLTTSTNHGLAVDWLVRFPASGLTQPPAPLAEDTDYWVQAIPISTTLKLSATRGGAAINITGAMTGTPNMIASAWTGDFSAGTFLLAGNPVVGDITCDCYGLTQGAGSLQASYADELIEQVLTSGITDTPLSSADLDAASFAAFASLSICPLGKWLTEQTRFTDLLDEIMLSVGGWWNFSSAGLLRIGRLDLPTGAGPTLYSFIADDVRLRSFKLMRRILPRKQITLAGDRRYTVQTNLAGSVAQFVRDYYGTEYTFVVGAPTVTTWDTDPANHLRAVAPAIDKTLITEMAFSGDEEAQRVADLFQYPNGIWGFQTNQVACLLEIGSEIYIDHPKHTGYGVVTGLTKKIRGNSTVEFFCQLPDLYPTADIA